MKSIRIFLIVTLISSITLVNFLSALHGYRESMAEATRLFDAQLAEHAHLLTALTNTSNNAVDAIANVQDSNLAMPYQSGIEFQIWNKDRQLVLKSTGVPDRLITPLNTGYGTVNFGGYRWRLLVYLDPATKRWVITAQRNDVRYKIAEQLILKSVLPTVLWLPMAGVLIWLIVGFGLKPIRQLAAALKRKQASDLSPVRLDTVPKELNLLAESANDLLRRLDASFSRERRFAADAAHELRTPLSVLKVQIHNLIATNNPSEEIMQLKTGIDRMSHTVEQILLLNRMAPDTYIAQLTCLNLTKVVQQAIRDHYNQFANKKQTIEFEGEQAMIYADPHATDILLANLLSNASKYTPKGGQIMIQTQCKEQTVDLLVSDSGPGIPPDQYQRVFERFYRVGGDRHPSNTLGCGLGLAIVSYIAELHGAHIELSKSEYNSGLCVTVHYPTGPQCQMLDHNS